MSDEVEIPDIVYHYTSPITKEDIKKNPTLWALFFCFFCTLFIVVFIILIIILALELKREKVDMSIKSINSTGNGYYKVKNELYLFKSGEYHKCHSYCVHCPRGKNFRFDCGYWGILTEAIGWCGSKLNEYCRGAGCSGESRIKC